MERTANTNNVTFLEEHKCEICEKVSKTQMQLRAHYHHVHASSEIYLCNICSRSFQTQHGLKLYLKRLHGGQKDFKCESCGKFFSEEG